MLSASGGYHDSCGGHDEYKGGCSAHQGFQYILNGFYNFAHPHTS